MSSRMNGDRATKRTHSLTSRERINQLRQLRYDQNRDEINEHRTCLYHRRRTSNVVPNQLPGSHKYRSMADIMQTKFPINVYSP